MSSDLPRSCTVEFEARAFAEAYKAYMKGNLHRAFLGACQWSAVVMLGGMVLYLLPHHQAVVYGEEVGFAWFLGLSILVGFAAYAIASYRQFNADVGGIQSEVWTIEVREDGWSYTGRTGIQGFIPWSQLKVDLDLPDAYLVRAYPMQFLVFRAPLRTAGLDEEFAARVRSAVAEGAALQ
jgi:hypothetical protein